MVVQNARASGGKGVVLWVGELQDLCRHLSEPRSARFGILTVQDVAKRLAELWGKHPVGL